MRSRRLSVLVASTAAVFAATSIFIGIPALVFAANSSEFRWPFANAIATLWPWFATTIALLALPAIVLPIRLAAYWAGATAAIAGYVWLHGTFQVRTFGEFDGKPWTAWVPTWQNLLEFVVIAAVLALLWECARRFPLHTAGIQTLLALGMLVQALPVVSETGWLSISHRPRMSDVADFSPKSNALIVLMDTMSSDVFERVATTTPSLRNTFDGFTLYPDTVGAAPSTLLAMPTIHSGRIYTPRTAVRPFFDDAIKNRSILTKIDRAGYRSVLTTSFGPCPRDVTCISELGALKGESEMARAEGLSLLDAVLFRLAPLRLKQQVYNDGEWVFRPRATNKEFPQQGLLSDALLKEVARSVSASSRQPTLKFLHLMSTHPPRIFDDNCRYAGHTLPATEDNFATQVKCSLQTFAKLLKALKSYDVYDNTAIMLIADHGSPEFPSRRLRSDDEWAKMIAAANPTFAVKPFRARGHLKKAPGEVAIGDFGATLCDLLAACQSDRGQSALLKPTGRIRRYNNYQFKNDFWTAERLGDDVTSFTVNGPMTDNDSWDGAGTIRVGEVVKFNVGGTSSRYTQQGWLNAEKWGRWTDGRTAKLSLQPTTKDPVRLTLNAKGLVAGQPQEVRVVVNDRPVGVLEFDTNDSYSTADVAVPESKDGRISVEFQIAHPFPAGGHNLGLGVRWLRLERAALSSG